MTSEGSRQFHVDVENEEWKVDPLRDMKETLAIRKEIICCTTRGDPRSRCRTSMMHLTGLAKPNIDFEVWVYAQIAATDVELFTIVILAHVTISLTLDLLVDNEL